MRALTCSFLAVFLLLPLILTTCALCRGIISDVQFLSQGCDLSQFVPVLPPQLTRIE